MHSLPFPLMSIRFASVFPCFGCFCLLVFTVLAGSSEGNPYHLCRFPSDSLVFWPAPGHLSVYSRGEPKTPKKRTPKADRSEPAPGPNCLHSLSVYSRREPKGKVLSVQPRPRRQTELRSFWPAPGLRLLPERTKRQGSIRSRPPPSAKGAAIGFWAGSGA